MLCLHVKYLLLVFCYFRKETDEQVSGYSKAEYKKFSTEEEAKAYLSEQSTVSENTAKPSKEYGSSHLEMLASCTREKLLTQCVVLDMQ